MVVGKKLLLSGMKMHKVGMKLLLNLMKFIVSVKTCLNGVNHQNYHVCFLHLSNLYK